MEEVRPCVWCGVSLKRQQKFCSHECRSACLKNMKEKRKARQKADTLEKRAQALQARRDAGYICLRCGSDLPSTNKCYCSWNCFLRRKGFDPAIHKSCIWCGDEIKEQAKYCSDKCRRECWADIKHKKAAAYKVYVAAETKRRYSIGEVCKNCGNGLPPSNAYYCSRLCRSQYSQPIGPKKIAKWSFGMPSLFTKDEANEIAKDIRQKGYGQVASDLGLTRSALIGRIYRHGHRFIEDHLARCRAGRHNTRLRRFA